jgi:predicted nuclease of predicted toxin-antitoxin system
MGMKFKIDENLPVEVADVLNSAGHNALTISDQQMVGADDSQIASVCKRERRVLITLDLGFADIRQYPPREFTGIIVLRLNQQDKDRVIQITEKLLSILNTDALKKKLWIVEEHRVRIRDG